MEDNFTGRDVFAHSSVPEVTINAGFKLPEDKLFTLRSTLQEKHVEMSWSDDRSTVTLKANRRQLSEASDEVKELIENSKILQYHIYETQALYLQKNFCQSISAALRGFHVPHYVINGKKILVCFKAKGETMNAVLEKLNQLTNNVVSDRWDLNHEFKDQDELGLIKKTLSTSSLKEIVQALEPQTGNSLTTDLSTRTSATSLITNITDTCQLVIKYGKNITLVEEDSKVLVCPLTEKRLLTSTRVGIALRNAFPALQELLNREVKMDSRSRSTTYIVKGPFSEGLQCQDIIFAVIPHYSTQNAEEKLAAVLEDALTRIISLGVETISFPPMGFGRALGYTPSNVASVMLNTFNMLKSSGNIPLKRITVLAPEYILLDEYDRELKEYLMTSPEGMAEAANAEDSEPQSMPHDDDTAQESLSDYVDDERDTGSSHGADSSLNTSKILIAGVNSGTINNFRVDITRMVTEKYLYTKCFQQEVIATWPQDSQQAILEKAKKIPVLVKPTTNPMANTPNFTVQGKKESVAEMMKFIKSEFDKHAQSITIRRIISPQAPQRGTVEFMKHAANSNELCPSYWRQRRSLRNMIRHAFGYDYSPYEEIYVDRDTKNAITELICTHLWKEDLVGRSVDAAGLSHNGIRVIDVKRVQNHDLFQQYSAQRKRLFHKMSSQGHTCSDIAQLPESSGAVTTTGLVADVMKRELYYEVNEHYLLCGVKNAAVDALLTNGFQKRVHEHIPMFGTGIYFTESSTKADQLVDTQYNRVGRGVTLTMILARVTLGNAYICNEADGTGAIRPVQELNQPPCMQCLRDRCNCPDQEFYDSVVRDGAWNFREFVVYEPSYCYPEYVIRYQRV